MRPGFVADLRASFRVVVSSPWLWATIVLFAVGNVLMTGGVAVALPLLARERLGGTAAFGSMLAGLAVGSILGALALGRMGRPRRRRLLAYGAVAVSGGRWH